MRIRFFYWNLAKYNENCSKLRYVIRGDSSQLPDFVSRTKAPKNILSIGVLKRLAMVDACEIKGYN